MDPATASALGAGVGLLSGVGNFITGQQGVANQRAALDWQKAQWNEFKQREDTAVQRRVADLKAAGLSPVLAAGQAAASTPPIKIEGAPSDKNPFESLQTALTGALQMQQLRQSQASTDAALAQAALTSVNAETAKAIQGSVIKRAAYEAENVANMSGISGQDLELYKISKKWPRIPTGMLEDLVRLGTSADGRRKLQELYSTGMSDAVQKKLPEWMQTDEYRNKQPSFMDQIKIPIPGRRK